MSDVDGVVENGWEQVADTFRANFKEGKDLGAGCCVYVDGRAVVDLWGGLADREKNRPWERDTVVARRVDHEGCDRNVRTPPRPAWPA